MVPVLKYLMYLGLNIELNDSFSLFHEVRIIYFGVAAAHLVS